MSLDVQVAATFTANTYTEAAQHAFFASAAACFLPCIGASVSALAAASDKQYMMGNQTKEQSPLNLLDIPLFYQQ